MGIRVLHVLHSYRQGGMENMIGQMAWELSETGFKLGVCALAGTDVFKNRLPPDTPVWDLEKRRGLDLRCAARLRRLIHDIRPDVVHSHNWNALIYSLLAIGSGHTPLLHGEHALFYTWERSAWRLWLRRLFYARCDIVHTVSQGQVKDMARLGLVNHADIRVIRNGVDTARFKPLDQVQCRHDLGIPAEGLCIGMAARYVPEKRHVLLLQAFERIGAAFPHVNLVLCGAGGSCEAEVRSLAANHLFASRIFQLGHRNDMSAVYSAMDLLVLTSTSEGMSNVTLEAMSCGVPVLMNSACGSEELIRDDVNGRAVSMETFADVAAAVGRLVEQPDLLRTMGVRARAGIVQDYPLARTAADYASVYAALAHRRHTSTERG